MFLTFFSFMAENRRLYPIFIRGLIVLGAISLLVLTVSVLRVRTRLVEIFDKQIGSLIVNENVNNASDKDTIWTAGSKPDILHKTTTLVEKPIVEQFEKLAQVEGLLKEFYDTVQQPRSVFTLYEGLKQKTECVAKPSFSGVSSDKSPSDPKKAVGCLLDDESCVSALPPVFLRNVNVLFDQTQKHVFLNPYQTKMFLSSQIISERLSHKKKHQQSFILCLFRKAHFISPLDCILQFELPSYVLLLMQYTFIHTMFHRSVRITDYPNQ